MPNIRIYIEAKVELTYDLLIETFKKFRVFRCHLKLEHLTTTWYMPFK